MFLKQFFDVKSAKSRISMGLVSMLVCLVISASYMGLIPDRYSAVVDGRVAIAETIAVNSSVFITRNDLRRMQAHLKLLISRDDNLLSGAIKNSSGKTVVELGEHGAHWQAIEDGLSTEAQIVVPLWEGAKRWGTIELRFEPIKRQDWLAFFFEPLSILIMFLGLSCYICFHLYLGRMLKQLDPSQAIPDRVRSALDTMAEGLLVLDAKRNVVLANEAFSRLVDVKSEKLLGQKIEAFAWQKVADEQGVEADYPWQLALNSSEVIMNHMLRMTVGDDEVRTFMTNCSPVLGPNGKAAGVMVSFDDITELEEKEVQLRLSKDEAEQANRAKSDFLANMSHEIRTPMNAILGFTEVLKRGYDKNPEESKRYLATISSSGQHLLGLINDILDLSKVESGKIELELLPYAAHAVAQEVVKIMSVKAQEKDLSITFEPLTNVPEQLMIDSAKLRQILTNLIGNAIKFTEQGGVTVSMKYFVQVKRPMLEIKVADTGIGMSDAQAEAVFSPFVQADSSITRRFGGTGLGLTISKRFAEAMNGDIIVTSQQGEGSQFTLVIEAEAAEGAKLLEADELLVETHQEGAVSGEQWQFKGSRILVVDDGDENRDLLEVVLSDVGLTIDTAVDGQDGLDKVRANEYELVLMDVQMPVMDGYTAVGHMRKEGYSLPIIALTANAMKGAEQACLDAGYSGYMTKPIDIDRLLARLADELPSEQVSTALAEAADETVPIVAPLQARQEETIQPETTQVETTQVETTQAGPDELVVGEPISSTLPLNIPKFQALVDKFILRLAERLRELDAAVANQDYQTIADLGHWLKGSAGSVGFHDFTEPALELEEQAKQQQQLQVEASVKGIHTLYQRIRLGRSGSTKHVPLTPTHLNTPDEHEIRHDIPPADTEKAAPIVTTDSQPAVDGPPITSTLPVNIPKFQALVDKFIVRLDERLKELDHAVASQDYQTIADLGHWLKGSAGSVGFHDFTEPALELEEQAKQQQQAEVEATVAELRSLYRRIDSANTSGGLAASSPEEQQASTLSETENIPKSENQGVQQQSPVTSDLLRQNPKLVPMAEKFVAKLEGKLQEMHQLNASGDYQTLADMGHWLKGSAGTLGFTQFTEPSADLEIACKNGQAEDVVLNLSLIDDLYRRIALPETSM